MTSKAKTTPKSKVRVRVLGRTRPQGAVARPLAQRQEISGWTADRILAAVGAADGGDFRALGDLVAAIGSDDRVLGVSASRTVSLLGMPLDFVFGDPAFQSLLRGDETVPGLWYLTHCEPEVSAFLRDALLMGMGLAQRVPDGAGRYRLVRWDPGDLSRMDLGQGRYQWRVRTATDIRDIEFGTGEWILHTPFGEVDPYKHGLWRALMLPWLLKRLAAEDRANGSEQAGLSNPTLIASEGSTEKQRQKVAAQFSTESRKLALILPFGWAASYLQPPQKIFEIYSETIAWADAAITIAIAGQVVTTEGSPGFSSGNVQDQIKNDLIRYDGEALGSTFYHQDLPHLAVESGFLPEDACYPVWNTTRPLDREQFARTLEILSRAAPAIDAALSGHDKRMDLLRVCEVMGIPVLDAPRKASDVQVSVLNGAQISAVVDIVTKVAEGTLPRSSGLNLLISLMQVDPSAAERIIGDAGTPKFVPPTDPVGP